MGSIFMNLGAVQMQGKFWVQGGKDSKKVCHS